MNVSSRNFSLPGKSGTSTILHFTGVSQERLKSLRFPLRSETRRSKYSTLSSHEVSKALLPLLYFCLMLFCPSCQRNSKCWYVLKEGFLLFTAKLSEIQFFLQLDSKVIPLYDYQKDLNKPLKLSLSMPSALPESLPFLPHLNKSTKTPNLATGWVCQFTTGIVHRSP